LLKIDLVSPETIGLQEGH